MKKDASPEKIDTRIRAICTWKNENFIQLAQMLAVVRRNKLWKDFGCGSFTEYIEIRHSVSMSFANNLCAIGDYMLNMNDDTIYEHLKELGYDKTSVIVHAIAKGLLTKYPPPMYHGEEKDNYSIDWIYHAKNTDSRMLGVDIKRVKLMHRKLSGAEKVRLHIWLSSSDFDEFDGLLSEIQKKMGVELGGTVLLCGLRELYSSENM